MKYRNGAINIPLRGTTSILYQDYSGVDEIIRLNPAKEWEIGLEFFFCSSNHIYNITRDKNNTFTFYKQKNEIPTTIVIKPGAYEVAEIIKYIHGNKNAIEANITLEINKHAHTIIMHSPTHIIDLTSDNSVGHLLGFNKQIIPAGKKVESDTNVKIFPVETIKGICSECDSGPEKILLSFPIKSLPGERIIYEPAKAQYYRVRNLEISEVVLHIYDQNGNCIENNGEEYFASVIIREVR